MATELPKQYDPKESQRRWLHFWDERGYFHSEPDAAQAVLHRHPAAERDRRVAHGPCPQ